jgi:hypothetical protein
MTKQSVRIGIHEIVITPAEGEDGSFVALVARGKQADLPFAAADWDRRARTAGRVADDLRSDRRDPQQPEPDKGRQRNRRGDAIASRSGR